MTEADGVTPSADMGTASESVTTPDDIPEFTAPAPQSNLSRRLRKKQRRKKSQRLYMIAVPVVCFLAFFGVMALIALSSKPELKGKLQASVAPRMEVPTETVAVSLLGLTSDEETQVFQAFEDSPESFLSTQMRCTIQLDGASLSIDVTAMSGFTWFAVNPNSDATLAEWIRDNRVSVNKQRLKRIAESGKVLCMEKIRKAAGDPVAFTTEICRDGFALNARVNAFGYVIEAVTKNRRSPCVHEDSKGTLYFILPEETKTFRLRGRKLGQSKALFPGDYLVEVKRTESAAPEPDPEDVPPSTDTSDNEGEMMSDDDVNMADEKSDDETMGMTP